MSIGLRSFKKLVGALAVVVLGTGTVLALDMSVGISGAFRNNFGSGVDFEEYVYTEFYTKKYNGFGSGFNTFFDITYAEFNLGMTFFNYYSEGEIVIDGGTSYRANYKFTLSLNSFDIGAFGKYPIDLGGMTLFPMIGIDYHLVLFGKYTEELTGFHFYHGEFSGKQYFDLPNARDFSRLWFKFGLGMDIHLTETLFVRPRILYGMGLVSKYENAWVDMAKMFEEVASVVFSHGFDIRVGVGFML